MPGAVGSQAVAAAAAPADPAAADRAALASRMLASSLQIADNDGSEYDYSYVHHAPPVTLPLLTAVGAAGWSIHEGVQRLGHPNAYTCRLDHKQLAQ